MVLTGCRPGAAAGLVFGPSASIGLTSFAPSSLFTPVCRCDWVAIRRGGHALAIQISTRQQDRGQGGGGGVVSLVLAHSLLPTRMPAPCDGPACGIPGYGLTQHPSAIGGAAAASQQGSSFAGTLSQVGVLPHPPRWDQTPRRKTTKEVTTNSRPFGRGVC